MSPSICFVCLFNENGMNRCIIHKTGLATKGDPQFVQERRTQPEKKTPKTETWVKEVS